MEKLNFELAMVINGKLSEKDKNKELENIKSILNNLDCTIGDIADWGKRRLAYQINKTREGYYYFITFKSTTNIVKELENKIRKIENILRFITVKIEDYEY